MIMQLMINHIVFNSHFVRACVSQRVIKGLPVMQSPWNDAAFCVLTLILIDMYIMCLTISLFIV